MLLSITINNKSFGTKQLYNNLQFSVEAGQKVGLIGRNGTGKSTLLGMVTGDDKDYDGEIILKRGSVLVSSRQEHHGFENDSIIGYIQADLPEFAALSDIITNYPTTMGSNTRLIQDYSDALTRFGELGYYEIEQEVAQALAAYGIDPERLHDRLGSLSGGQKRMVELIKVQRSRGNLALIDEPTNHMDYAAKQAFIAWMERAQEAVVVITHDRDVLQKTDRIIEIRDGQAVTFRGNYNDYLRANTGQVVSQVNEYDITQKRIKNTREDIIRFQRLKEKSRDPGTIRRFKSQEQQARRELEQLQELEKPSFWIDQDSVAGMNKKLSASYNTYKARNIHIDTSNSPQAASQQLLDVSKLSVGYGSQPLFQDISFQLYAGQHIRLHGRNGAGKTTLIQAILAQAGLLAGTPAYRVFAGTVAAAREINIGVYHQEINPKYLQMTLADAITSVLADAGITQNARSRAMQLMSEYLFNPIADGEMPLMRLSGGQKARFQLIAMLASRPQLLILDEPTNHLDLPSIEELEQALTRFEGAVLYISHDSYFAEKLGGTTVAVGQA